MTPDRRTRWYWTCQIAGWTVYALANMVIVLAFSESEMWRDMLSVLLVAAAGISATHLYRYLAQRWGWTQLSVWRLVPRVLVSCVVLAAAVLAVVSALHLALPEAAEIAKATTRQKAGAVFLSFFNMSAVMLMWSLVYFGIHLVWHYNEAQVERWKLEVSLKETKLRALESQVNPHFLFNSLSSIRALVLVDPPQAQHMITQLSGLLRRALAAGEAPEHNLRHELRTVRAYLELEQMRLEERLRYELNIEEALLGRTVPVMLLQTLVENAIKHGIARLPEGGDIRVRVCTAPSLSGAVWIEVVNTGHLDQAGRPGGVGLKNARERLTLLYGPDATLTLEAGPPGHVTARVTLPPTPDAPAADRAPRHHTGSAGGSDPEEEAPPAHARPHR